MNSQERGASRAPSLRSVPQRAAPRPTRDVEQPNIVFARIEDEAGQPLRATYEVESPFRAVVARGETDRTGIVRVTVERPGSYVVKVLELKD
jgi:hypothetical protein